MNGDKISLVLFRVPSKDVGELRFVEIDFSTVGSTADGVLLYPESLDIKLPTTVFMGANTMLSSNGGITIYQSYTIGSALTFQTSS